MKRFSLVAFLGVLLLALVAVAAVPATVQRGRWLFLGGVGIGSGGDAAGNLVTKTLGGSIAFDFASVTITCEDSTGIAVTGARTGDACFVGAPTTVSGAGTGLHSTFSCYVSAADTVKVRHCAAGTADNPASATYFVRVISGQ